MRRRPVSVVLVGRAHENRPCQALILGGHAGPVLLGRRVLLVALVPWVSQRLGGGLLGRWVLQDRRSMSLDFWVQVQLWVVVP